MKSNVDEILQIIRQNELGDCVRWLLENNMSQSLPYHNFDHALDVMYYAYKAFKYSSLHFNSRMPMLIAALFHDCNHSGGFFRIGFDNCNTENARFALSQYMQTLDSFFNGQFFDADRKKARKRIADCAIAAEFIDALTYPHKPISVNTSPAVLCLRDADLFQVCSTLFSSVVGIKNESFKHMSWEEFFQKEIEFLQQIEFKSAWGKDIAEPKKQETIEYLKRLQLCCYNPTP